MALDEQIAILNRSAILTCKRWRCRTSARLWLVRPAAFGLRLAGGQAFADTGHGMQHGLAQIRQYGELADLVRDGPEDFRIGARIQFRAVGRDGVHTQAPSVQMCPKCPKKGGNVGLVGIMIEHLVEQPLEGAVIDNPHSPCSWGKCGQDAERPIVEFVRRQIAGKVGQSPIQILSLEPISVPFSPRPRPSSGSWRKGRIPDGRARDANWRLGKAGRLPPPRGRPSS